MKMHKKSVYRSMNITFFDVFRSAKINIKFLRGSIRKMALRLV